MGFIRQALRGKLYSSRRKQDHEPEEEPQRARPRHALDTLPTLPTTRRPVTPTPPNPQFTSPFFRLPPELRQQIYRLLLSSREIHIDMRYTAANTATPHSTRGATLDYARRWRWRASNCHRHPDAHPLSDGCGWGGPPPTACALFDTPCVVGREVLGLLCCCRLAYREAVEVLYAENTFHVSTGALVLATDRLLPRGRAAAVTRLIYQVTEQSAWDHAGEQLGLVPGLPAYEALLLRLPEAFPSLARLLVIVKGSLRERRWVDGRAERVDPPSREPVIRNCLLSSMDAVAAGFRKPLAECVLAMAHSAFDRVMEEERAKADKIESREGKWLQFWRPLDKGPDTGYWVRRLSPEERTGSELDFTLF